MSRLRVLIALALLPLFAAGTANADGNNLSDEARCAIIGSATGAGGGLLVSGEIIGAIIGAGVGAIVGQMSCSAEGIVDGDGDGVADDKDNCPKVPPSIRTDVRLTVIRTE